MNGGAHLAIGAGCGAALVWGAHSLGAPVPSEAILAGAVVAGVGALAPDMDHPWSTISGTIPGMLLTAGVLLAVSPLILRLASSSRGLFSGLVDSLMRLTQSWWQWGVLLIGIALVWFLVSRLVSVFLGHRGPAHSLAAAGAAALAGVCIAALFGRSPGYGLLFGVGWLTHLAADAGSRMGLPALLWPLDSGAIRLRFEDPASGRTPINPEGVRTPEQQSETGPAMPPMRVSLAPEPQTPALGIEVAIPLCPNCNVPMVLRTARRGPHEGERFYGCVNFPRCRQTRTLV